jgi:hypothetical protein
MKDQTMAHKTSAERPENTNRPAERAISLGQGAYYLATGMWPLASMGTFESVTGPKVDKWLVKTVGVLVAVIGVSLMVAARRKEVSPEARLLATGSAGGLAAIDVIYVAKGRISPVYLLDAAGEMALLMMWKLRRAKRRARLLRASTHRPAVSSNLG